MNLPNRAIHGVLHLPKRKNPPYVITCHGLFSTMESDKFTAIADAFTNAGIATIRFDFSGCGKSSGNISDTTISRRIEELSKVVDFSKNHPALGSLPHDGWCDLNFVHLISGIYPITLELFYPTHIDPIIRSIGFQNSMVDKAYMFEVRIGRGSLLATSLKLLPTYKSHPESRYLVESILKYAVSNEFKPDVQISKEQLVSVLYSKEN